MRCTAPRPREGGGGRCRPPNGRGRGGPGAPGGRKLHPPATQVQLATSVTGGHAMSPHWVTFDCFGTLVDWHAGFASVLRPIAGDRLPELLAAYHRHERAAETERPHRLYRDVLETALRRAADQIGMPLTD